MSRVKRGMKCDSTSEIQTSGLRLSSSRSILVPDRGLPTTKNGGSARITHHSGSKAPAGLPAVHLFKSRPDSRKGAPVPRIRKVLVANRGEIARRVLRTVRGMGSRGEAVYSAADAQAQHVAAADEAVRIGPAPSAKSYLAIDNLLAAAQATGADAVHPGYGFLSENATFAERCATAGLTFIGPPPAAIRAMGSKIEAKRIMAEAGVPVIPGVSGAGLDDDALARAAGGVGFPLLVKASAGGGGKGMRVVQDAGALPAALAAARREARGAFGDDTLLVERYVERPRHVELQIFADT